MSRARPITDPGGALRQRLWRRARGNALLRRIRPVAHFNEVRDRLSVWARRLPIRELYPNFLIIGAQKAGTSSLHFYLHQHPQIFMTSFKETNLFLADSDRLGPYHAREPHFYGSSSREKRRGLSDEQILRRMLRGYRGEPLIGDASPYYTCAPCAGLEVPSRVLAVRPEMKFVYMLRNPLDRIVSNYLHDLGLHQAIGEPIPEDLDARLSGYPHYLDISLYWRQLENYLRLFEPSRFRIVVFEEFRAAPAPVLEELCRFLGADPAFRFDTGRVHNASALRGISPASQLCFSRESYGRLIGRIREDVERLEAFLGHRIAAWDLSEEHWCQD